jgi:hypothetical protein
MLQSSFVRFQKIGLFGDKVRQLRQVRSLLGLGGGFEVTRRVGDSVWRRAALEI